MIARADLRLRDRIIKTTILACAALLSVALLATPAGARGGGGRSNGPRSAAVPLRFEAGFPVIVARADGNEVPPTIELAQAPEEAT